ncbi:YesK-like family protein [Mesobacillus maritimus]|uniref:YesK-like protein n=1 Tax=Mesobacillus maritimus TaxID=1643336 RepID=A0ABS7KBX5_9BACI|nr:YesK-like family protein [Mesobacillus maritimus]MBY0099571.1 hypothetical protein [Mesobacillus maritimus]
MIVSVGFFFGVIILLFTLILLKRSGKYYLAPIITVLAAVLVTIYGMFMIGGFEGMAYGILAVGIFLAGLGGVMVLPFLGKVKKKPLNIFDRLGLVLLPLILFGTIGLNMYFDEGYWIIEEGAAPSKEQNEEEELQSHYRISTISEGMKQVTLILGKEYRGKDIEVEKVSKWGSTEITVKMIESENKDEIPYIMIGLDEIKEPLKVQTTDGTVIPSVMDGL